MNQLRIWIRLLGNRAKNPIGSLSSDSLNSLKGRLINFKPKRHANVTRLAFGVSRDKYVVERKMRSANRETDNA
jgi:hypothetical protein